MYRTTEEVTFIELQVGVTATSITMDGFILGTTYVFKVKSRNAFDYSTGFSNEVTILAAMTPEKPLTPTTTFNRVANTVIIDWEAPYDNGSVILGYTVEIRQDNLLYTTEITDCDGANIDIMAVTECTVPVPTLMLAPFSHPWGTNIYAKVTAYNLYGDSITSESGYEAIILRLPDTPVDLAETVSARTENSITFTWSPGAEDGGTPVLDYRISYDQGIGTFSTLETGISE